MEKSDPDFRQHGFTLVEVLVVIIVIFLLGVMLLPPLARSTRAKVPLCLNHLRQIDVGFWMFASDNHDQFPMQIPLANGGTMESTKSEHVFPDFEKFKNYNIEPELFICPFETNRQPAASYEVLNDLNLSYFINKSATATNPPRSILTGDRFLQINGKPVEPGVLTITPNLNLGWTPGFHANGGSLAFRDGHAEFTRDQRLVTVINSPHLLTNRFCIP